MQVLESKDDMLPVRWNRPNSVHDGVIQYISSTLVKEADDQGNIEVLWPRKGRKPELWKGSWNYLRALHLKVRLLKGAY